MGGHAVAVMRDMSDLVSVLRAAAEVLARGLPLVGLLNNARVQNPRVTKNVTSSDTTFATNHLGPFASTGALIPHPSRWCECPLHRGRPPKIPSAGLPNEPGFAAAAISPPRRARRRMETRWFHSASASMVASGYPGGLALRTLTVFAQASSQNSQRFCGEFWHSSATGLFAN